MPAISAPCLPVAACLLQLPPHPPAHHHLQLLLTKVDDEDDVAGTIAELVSVLPLKSLRQEEIVS